MVNQVSGEQRATLAKATGTLIENWEQDDDVHSDFVEAMGTCYGSVPVVFGIHTDVQGGLRFLSGAKLAECAGSAPWTDLSTSKSSGKTRVIRVGGYYLYVLVGADAKGASAVAMQHMASIKPKLGGRIARAFQSVAVVEEESVPVEFDSLISEPGVIFILSAERKFVSMETFIDAVCARTAGGGDGDDAEPMIVSST